MSLRLKEDDVIHPLHYGQCYHPRLGLGYNDTWEGHEGWRKDGAWGRNIINGFPLITGEDFGCLHFSEGAYVSSEDDDLEEGEPWLPDAMREL